MVPSGGYTCNTQAWFEQGASLTPGLAAALAGDEDDESDAFASRSTTAAAAVLPPSFGGTLASGEAARRPCMKIGSRSVLPRLKHNRVIGSLNGTSA